MDNEFNRNRTPPPVRMEDLEEVVSMEDLEEVVEGAPVPVEEVEPKEPHHLLSFLRGDLVDPETKESFGLEGFKTKTYNPGGKSGITIGTGIDLGQHNKQGMIKAGVPEEIAEKLSPYYGKSDKSLAGQSPLTKEEVEEVDEAVMAHTIEELKEDIPHFDDMPQEMQRAAVMAKHQYGSKWPTLKRHLKDKDYREAIGELLSWEDSSEEKGDPSLGENIAKKYHALGKISQQAYFADFEDAWHRDVDTEVEDSQLALKQEAEQQGYKKLRDGWYRDPDTGEKFEVVDGRRM
jgi:hypothetical protein